MALNTLEQNTINRGCAAAKKLLNEVLPILNELNVIYDTETTGVKATVDQTDIDAHSAYSGLTKTQLDDGMYALTATTKTALTNAYTALAQLAARAS